MQWDFDNTTDPSPGLVSTDVAIVGGGAAGLATAIFCGRLCPCLKITILDGARKLGAKILVSGGGRCNVTNRVVSPDDFWGGKPNVIRRVLGAFSAEQTVRFFASIGVDLKEEPGNGKLFPTTNKAQTVLRGMLDEADRLGVQILCDHRVTDVQRLDMGFIVSTPGIDFHTDHLILATGGQSLPRTGSDGFGYRLATKLGHGLVNRTPALDPLILHGDFHKHLSGISHPATITIASTGHKPTRVTGELLWTHFGISGPVALDASRHWYRANVEEREVTVSLNFLPDHDLPKAEARIVELAKENPKTQLHNALTRVLPARVSADILKRLEIDPTIQMSQLRKELRRRLTHALLAWRLDVKDGRGYTFAEATAGGVRLNEVDPNTLCSRKCPNLYLVGELLDVDGRIGGFNFQWAWSGAWVVANALARMSQEKA